jgi:hypothetical protein
MEWRSDSHAILCIPRKKDFRPDPTLLKKFETYFANYFSGIGNTRLQASDVRSALQQSRFDRWGKVRRAHGHDVIRSVVAMYGSTGNQRERDSSYVKVQYLFAIHVKFILEFIHAQRFLCSIKLEVPDMK